MKDREPFRTGVPRSSLGRAAALLHRAVLGLLVVCALIAAFVGPAGGAGDGAGDVPPRRYTIAAVGLALGVVMARRFSTSPRIGDRASARWTIASLLLTAALGLLAAALAVQTGGRQSALVITLAAGLFALRPPALARAPNRAAGP